MAIFNKRKKETNTIKDQNTKKSNEDLGALKKKLSTKMEKTNLDDALSKNSNRSLNVADLQDVNETLNKTQNINRINELRNDIGKESTTVMSVDSLKSTTSPTSDINVVSPIESYDFYDVAKRKIITNYERIQSANTFLTIEAVALQVHLYLFDHKFYEIEDLLNVFRPFARAIFEIMHKGKALVLSENTIFDSLIYDKEALPIIITHSKLILQSQLVPWVELVAGKTEEKIKILEGFIVIIENALNAGFEVEFRRGVLLLRTQNSNQPTTFLVASKKFLSNFNSRFQFKKADQSGMRSESDKRKFSHEALSRIHYILNVETNDSILDLKKYERIKIERENKLKIAKEKKMQEEKIIQKTLSMAKQKSKTQEHTKPNISEVNFKSNLEASLEIKKTSIKPLPKKVKTKKPKSKK